MKKANQDEKTTKGKLGSPIKKSFTSYEEIITEFLQMVRKTITFEKYYMRKQSKQSKLLYPLLEEARYKLYQYYSKFLIGKIDRYADPYLREFIDSMEY